MWTTCELYFSCLVPLWDFPMLYVHTEKVDRIVLVVGNIVQLRSRDLV